MCVPHDIWGHDQKPCNETMMVSSLKLEIHWKLKRFSKEAVQNLNWYLMTELNHRILYPFWPIYRSQSWEISTSGAHGWRDRFSKQLLGHFGCDSVLWILFHWRLPCDSWGISLHYLLLPDCNMSSILLREFFCNKRSDANAKGREEMLLSMDQSQDSFWKASGWV